MALPSSTHGDLDDTLYNLGVQCTVAFKESVSAGTDFDGVHYFAKVFYLRLSAGYDAETAILEAAIAMDDVYPGNNAKTESVVLKGNMIL